MSCSDPAAGASGDFRFPLPEELIAQEPSGRRGDSRLLLVDRRRGLGGEVRFRELAGLLDPGDLLVVNDSRVLPARLRCRRAGTGGRIEILLIRPVGEGVDREPADDRWLAMARPARRLRAGERLLAGPESESARGVLVVEGRRDDGYLIVSGPEEDPLALAERLGEAPLPPYIRREPDDPATAGRLVRDRSRYQTVYARDTGSVAAPTAGLHFEQGLLDVLSARGIGIARVTLHVGPGTFRPPTDEQIAARRLHREIFHHPAATGDAVRRARESGGRIIAVGTTSLRVLETVCRLGLDDSENDREEWPLPDDGTQPLFSGVAVRGSGGWDVSGETRLFLRPPDAVEAVDGLVTNFHLPGSSLLMLVAAFTSDEIWRRAYEHAVGERFRFYSYGDAMLIL